MADRCCSKIGIDADLFFSLKCLYKTSPFQLLLIASFFSAVFLGLAVRLFERPYYDDLGDEFIWQSDPGDKQDYSYAWNGIWLVAITMTTVGFGDFYPQTHVGRFLIILSSFWGVFLVSMAVVSLDNVKSFNPSESFDFDVLHRLKTKKEIEQKAKICKETAFKYYIHQVRVKLATDKV